MATASATVGLNRGQVGGVVPLVAEHVKQHAVQLVLDLERPRRGQVPVARLDGRDLAFAVLPGGEGGEEDVVAPPGHVAPPRRPLLVHRDDVAVHPEQVQPEIAQQLVPVGVPARFGPRPDLGAGRGLDLEVAPHDGREVIDGVDGREVRLGEEVGREDEPSVRVHDKGFHVCFVSGARVGGPGVAAADEAGRGQAAAGVRAASRAGQRRRSTSARISSIQTAVSRRCAVAVGCRSAHG